MDDSNFWFETAKAIVRVGLCECGCGESTALATRTDARRRVIKGQPTRYIAGHNGNIKIHGPLTSHGYRLKRARGHPRAFGQWYSYIYEHVWVAEHALGHMLPEDAQVHHVNGNKADNRNENLVICENAAYHKLLHRRELAYRATGNANMLKCRFCHQWDMPKNLLRISTRPSVGFHAKCNQQNCAERYKRGVKTNGN